MKAPELTNSERVIIGTITAVGLFGAMIFISENDRARAKVTLIAFASTYRFKADWGDAGSARSIARRSLLPFGIGALRRPLSVGAVTCHVCTQ